MVRLVIGYTVATFGAIPVMWLVIDKYAWGKLRKGHNLVKDPAAMTNLLGIIERSVFFFALVIGAHEWVAAWFAVKVAAQWNRWKAGEERVAFNLMLIGSGLSILLASLGALIAVGGLNNLSAR